LDQHLRDAKFDVETHARPGATAAWFFTGENRTPFPGFDREFGAEKPTRPKGMATPKLPDLLAKHQPAYTVIALGSNFEWVDKGPLTDEIRRTIQAVRSGGSQCIWVGPPDMGTVPESLRLRFYRILGEVAAAEGCTVIDSFRILGLHPSCKGQERCDAIHWDGYPERARAWGHEVGRKIEEIVVPKK
jgi:hypothetical protein